MRYVAIFGSYQTGACDAVALHAQLRQPENARGLRAIYRVTDDAGYTMLSENWVPVTLAQLARAARLQERQRYDG